MLPPFMVNTGRHAMCFNKAKKKAILTTKIGLTEVCSCSPCRRKLVVGVSSLHNTYSQDERDDDEAFLQLRYSNTCTLYIILPVTIMLITYSRIFCWLPVLSSNCTGLSSTSFLIREWKPIEIKPLFLPNSV